MVVLIAFVVSVFSSLLFTFFIGEKDCSTCFKLAKSIRNAFISFILSIGCTKAIMGYKHFIVTEEYSALSYIILILLAIVIPLALLKLPRILSGDYSLKNKKIFTVLAVLASILFGIGCIAQFSSEWGENTFGNTTADQLIINITSPVDGTDPEIVLSGIEEPVFSVVFMVTAFSLVLFCKIKPIYLLKNDRGLIFSNGIKTVVCLLLGVAVLARGLYFAFKEYDLKGFYYSYVLKSDIIDENYVDPTTVTITFPKTKRNLIHIYLESMENSYLSKELGGNIDENLMPKLTELAYDGIVFSDTDNYFGGPQPGTGTQWSLASMVNQTTGLPMKAPGMGNSYGTNGKFLPGVFTLGELLESQGYEQTVMIGADAKFGGLNYLYSTHGNWKIMDYTYAIENNMLPDDYKINWGYEDDKLYEFAKEEITRLYNTGKPFNFTMETADTHFPDGFVPEEDPRPYVSPYANAILNSSNDTYEFIKWIQNQPFYDNTTIVIIGDHLSMETFFFEDYGFTDSYKRTQFNLILNPAPGLKNPDKSITTNRIWTNWDYFPTIIASIGAKIDGERLGIGTNLFSGKKTIYEELGFDYAENELKKGSDFYNHDVLMVEKRSDALA